VNLTGGDIRTMERNSDVLLIACRDIGSAVKLKFSGVSSAVRQMPGDLCTAPGIISKSPLSLVTDVTLGASDLWLGTHTGATGTSTLSKSIFWPQPMAPWTIDHGENSVHGNTSSRNGDEFDIMLGTNSYEKVKTFKYLDSLLTNQNSIQEEIKCRLKAGNSCYYSVQTLVSSRLLSKNLKIKIYKF
jgi:hypothetical protein